jgi:hypothetical protein
LIKVLILTPNLILLLCILLYIDDGDTALHKIAAVILGNPKADKLLKSAELLAAAGAD